MSEKKGFLTTADKAFLQGTKEFTGKYAKQRRYERRDSIRQRTREAFSDFALLYETLDETERDKIFDPPQEEWGDMLESLTKTVSFLYCALEGEVGSDSPSHRSFTIPFAEIVEIGVRHGEYTRQPQDPFRGRVNVDLTIEVEHTKTTLDTKRAIDQLAKNEGRGLSDAELRTLITHAVRDTIEMSNSYQSTVDGDPVDEKFDIPRHGLRGIAEQVEERVEEIESENSDEKDSDHTPRTE